MHAYFEKGTNKAGFIQHTGRYAMQRVTGGNAQADRWGRAYKREGELQPVNLILIFPSK
jgi:hypothetical protein